MGRGVLDVVMAVTCAVAGVVLLSHSFVSDCAASLSRFSHGVASVYLAGALGGFALVRRSGKWGGWIG